MDMGDMDKLEQDTGNIGEVSALFFLIIPLLISVYLHACSPFSTYTTSFYYCFLASVVSLYHQTYG